MLGKRSITRNDHTFLTSYRKLGCKVCVKVHSLKYENSMFYLTKAVIHLKY